MCGNVVMDWVGSHAWDRITVEEGKVLLRYHADRKYKETVLYVHGRECGADRIDQHKEITLQVEGGPTSWFRIYSHASHVTVNGMSKETSYSYDPLGNECIILFHF